MRALVEAELTSGAKARFGALHAHRFLFRAGFALASLFTWILVFQYFFLASGSITSALIACALMYSISQIATVILTPLSAAHLRRGVKQSIIFGAVLAGAAYVYLGATLSGTLDVNGELWGVAAFAFLLGAYRALYWTPYKLEAASEYGRSRMPIVYEIVLALLPVFAGITLAMQPFAPLRIFYGAAALFALSLIPLFFVRNIHESYEWSYFRTFREIMKPKNGRLYFATITHGVESAALFLVWPLAIFLIVGSNYAMLGVVMTTTLILIIMARYLFQRFMRRLRLDHSLPVSALLSASGWIMRIFVAAPISVVLADAYSHIGAPKRTCNIDVFTLEQVSDEGTFMDEYTVLKEIGLSVGRMLTAFLFAIILSFSGVAIAMVVILTLAALASAGSVLSERMHALPRF